MSNVVSGFEGAARRASKWGWINTKLLDYGYLKYVDHWGSDEAIVEAARMSTQKGFSGWGPREEDHSCARGGKDLSDSDQCAACHQGPGDEKLLKYLWDNKHATPFEMAGLVVEVQAPIFVFREWHRHRTQSFNEMSARYSPLPDLNYVPTVERLMATSATNQQAGTVKGAKELNADVADGVTAALVRTYRELQVEYERLLGLGVPKELARLILPVGRYSRMRASANLRNWLAFLTLRQAPQAQYEIRQYADALNDLVRALFPRTHALYAGQP
jgi:thymidylate synthase (FAD)